MHNTVSNRTQRHEALTGARVLIYYYLTRYYVFATCQKFIAYFVMHAYLIVQSFCIQQSFRSIVG